MHITEYKIKDYIDILASSASMPGGGSVSAIDGAEGISLILMVCNLTLGKEKYKKHERLIIKTKKECEKLKKEFLNLTEEDIKIFKNIEKVFAMPRNTEKEKAKRKAAMEKACKKCCEVPKKIIEKSLIGLNCAESILGKSNMSASSDLGVAAENLRCAANGAWLNVLINFKSIKDKKFIEKYSFLKKNELKEIERLSKKIYKKCI